MRLYWAWPVELNLVKETQLKLDDTRAYCAFTSMGICRTPNCGTPGRPFPACSICKQRVYCGSHCLVDIHKDQLLTTTDSDGAATFQIKCGDSVCPPCYEIWFPAEPAAEPEETDDENVDEEENHVQYEVDGKGWAG